jgi:sulfatase modifying factor 1
VVVIGIIGLIAVLRGGIPPLAAEEFDQTEETVAEEEKPEPTVTPTTEPTRNPILVLAEAGVNSNADWKPYIQDFDGVQMALVPVGCFQIGSTDRQVDYAMVLYGLGADRSWFDDEQPEHEVCFEELFWIDVYEVTNQQYGSSGEWSGDDLPREEVNWSDALAHCESRGARLPTEAEWEYAARGPDGLIFPWGNDFNGSLGNFCDENCTIDWADEDVDDGYQNTAPVGSYPGGVSWVGAYDLSGNVWEWVNDWYDSDYYASLPASNPQGPESGEYRVLRGGSWGFSATNVRAADRKWNSPDSAGLYLGFRCARDYEP